MTGDLSVLAERLDRIEKKLDSCISAASVPENIALMCELLQQNDFSGQFIRKTEEMLMNEVSFGNLRNKAYVLKKTRDFIRDSIIIYHETEPYVPEIKVFLGPTGVGKTTTVAKLAAESVRKGRRVGIITTDNYKAGADSQIESLAGIMNVPCVSVCRRDALEKQLEEWSPAMDMILVDTAGKSPGDEISRTVEMLAGCGESARKFLVLSATTKTSDLTTTVKRFGSFGYHAVICTKTDETSHLGNVLSALSETGISIAYLTTGQKLPGNIETASRDVLMGYLEGFSAV